MREKIYDMLPRAGIFISVAALFLSLIAGQGTRWEVWHFSVGLRLLKMSLYVAGFAGCVSLAGFICSLLARNRRDLSYALGGCILSGLLLGIPAYWAVKARHLPAIHDITTDTEDPPQFDAILSLRSRASNPPVYGGLQIASQQKAAYPDIAPLIVHGVRQGEYFDRALLAARRLGWTIVSADPKKGIIEAVDSTFWFGFKDDIVIRLRGLTAGVRVDIRSVSRVGISDIGTNASRIRKFLLIMARKR